MDRSALAAFAAPYYEKKDGMHNLRHIEQVVKAAERIVRAGKYAVDWESLLASAYFHGMVTHHEQDIRDWLLSQAYPQAQITKILASAKESLAESKPETIEGTILHDAHLLEGGKAYMITKCLITGSLRGQTLPQTIAYIEENIFDKRTCFLPETIPLFEEAQQYAKDFLHELKMGLL